MIDQSDPFHDSMSVVDVLMSVGDMPLVFGSALPTAQQSLADTHATPLRKLFIPLAALGEATADHTPPVDVSTSVCAAASVLCDPTAKHTGPAAHATAVSAFTSCPCGTCAAPSDHVPAESCSTNAVSNPALVTWDPTLQQTPAAHDRVDS